MISKNILKLSLIILYLGLIGCEEPSNTEDENIEDKSGNIVNKLKKIGTLVETSLDLGDSNNDIIPPVVETPIPPIITKPK